MTNTDVILYGTFIWTIHTAIVYWLTGLDNIKDCYGKWFTREYWKLYNIVEAASWAAKALIIVPGLIWGYQVWWFYIFTLLTSSTLIWASNKKLLPTLVAFNSIWCWISIMTITKHFIP